MWRQALGSFGMNLPRFSDAAFWPTGFCGCAAASAVTTSWWRSPANGAAHEHDSLERLCRYITRPALANERVRCNGAGHQVVLKLKAPWRDGTTHRVMSHLEFMQRLAALVPRPRLHPRQHALLKHRS